MNEVTVSSWNELNDILFSNTWNSTISRFRSNFAYRGLNKSSYKLENGIIRMGKSYEGMEKNLIRQFKKYSYNHLHENASEWHWLSVAQHHGLPTRLLDWTYSPLVALHFSTTDIESYSIDGAIWKINFADIHNLLPDEFRTILKENRSNIFSIDGLAASIKDLHALDHKRSKIQDIAIFFEPPSIDQRIVNQFAYFSALSDPALSMDDWLSRRQIKRHVSATKIIIPASLKWEVRDKLDQSNINERVLFPGLDGLSGWLKRHYKSI